MKFVLATLAAIVVQPLWCFAWVGASALIDGRLTTWFSDPMELGAFAVIVMIVAAPFVLLIGLPSGYVLQHARHRGAWLGLIGFVTAALPLTGDVYWDRLPSHGDLSVLVPLLVGGAHGLFGALAFHAVLRGFERVALVALRP